MGQSRMDNVETWATLDSINTTNTIKTKTQHKNIIEIMLDTCVSIIHSFMFNKQNTQKKQTRNTKKYYKNNVRYMCFHISFIRSIATNFVFQKILYRNVFPILCLECSMADSVTSALIPFITMIDNASKEEYCGIILPVFRDVINMPKPVQVIINLYHYLS
jgi:hypothetical protein